MIVVSTAAFHARVRGSFPGLGGLKETKMILPHPLRILGGLFVRKGTCSASDKILRLMGSVISPSSGDSPGLI